MDNKNNEALDKLQRFNNRGGLMNPEANGLYYRAEDVRNLLARAGLAAPTGQAERGNRTGRGISMLHDATIEKAAREIESAGGDSADFHASRVRSLKVLGDEGAAARPGYCRTCGNLGFCSAACEVESAHAAPVSAGIAAPAAPTAEQMARLREVLEAEFDCYRTHVGLIPWAINALLDNSPHKVAAPAAAAQPSLPAGWIVERQDYPEDDEMYAHTNYTIRGPRGEAAIIYDIDSMYTLYAFAKAAHEALAAPATDAGALEIACAVNKKLGDALLGRSYLLPDDLEALKRFEECASDFDSGGHDVPKPAMARLREIGVVQSIGFGRHQTTAFGDYVLERAAGEPVNLPLMTLIERNALAAATQEQSDTTKGQGDA